MFYFLVVFAVILGVISLICFIASKCDNDNYDDGDTATDMGIAMLVVAIIVGYCAYDMRYITPVRKQEQQKVENCYQSYQEMLRVEPTSKDFIDLKAKVVENIEICKKSDKFTNSDFYKQLQDNCEARAKKMANIVMDATSSELSNDEQLRSMCSKLAD